MSGETLRKVAQLLRERTDDVILATGEEPWEFIGIGYSTEHDGVTYTVRNTASVDVCEAHTEEQAEYIAAMHPAVGLALADWLEAEAEDMCQAIEAGPRRRAALSVVRAILGGTS